jgi:hypothetical protein
MRFDGVTDFRLVNVGRRLEAKKIIKIQSIRNAAGIDHRRLIQAFLEDVSDLGRNKKPQPKRRSPLEEAIESIDDIDVRTHLRWLVRNNSVLQRRVGEMQSAFKRLTATDESLCQRKGGDNSESATILEQCSFAISASEAFDLDRFLSDDYRLERDWRLNQFGGVIDNNDIPIVPSGVIEVLQRVRRSRGE